MKMIIEITDSQDFDPQHFIEWLNDQLNFANDAAGSDTVATIVEIHNEQTTS